MLLNKSTVYGKYGGVTKANHYVPPDSPNFIPQLAKLSFTEQDRQAVLQIAEQTKFYAEKAKDILVRTTVSSLPGNVDSFVISTSGKPEDILIYTSTIDQVDLNVADGGYF